MYPFYVTTFKMFLYISIKNKSILKLEIINENINPVYRAYMNCSRFPMLNMLIAYLETYIPKPYSLPPRMWNPRGWLLVIGVRSTIVVVPANCDVLITSSQEEVTTRLLLVSNLKL